MDSRLFIFREKLGDSPLADIFRGEARNKPGPALRLKVIKPRFIIPDTAPQLQQQLSLLEQLNIEGVLIPTLHSDGSSLILVQALLPSLSLDAYLQAHETLSISDTLKLGIALTEQLEKRHEKNWLHKAIKPGNIFITADFNHVELIDDVRILDSHQPNSLVDNTHYHLQTLPYQAPEQSGHFHVGLSQASDLYALGAVLYHCLSGRPPFFSSNPLSLIHSHLAEMPVSVSTLRNDCPPVLAEIVSLLLEKNPGKRYQSASGLKADLQRTLDKLQKKQTGTFRLKQHDTGFVFGQASVLLGREQELKELLGLYQDVCGGRFGLALIAGQSGIGKSRLIEALVPQILKRQGYFITGKYNQFSKHQPYAILIEAVGKLLRQIMSEDDVELKRWQQRLQQALGLHAQLLVSLIPELRVLIGEQSASPHLPPLEAQKQLQELFCHLLAVLASAQHPLVLFIDDLQWSDEATLDILERIASNPAHFPYLYIILAYRSNEISPQHRVHTIKDKLNQQNQPCFVLSLKALDKNLSNELIAQLLHSDAQHTLEISKHLYPITGGNPLLIAESLRWLYEQKGVSFSENEQQWHVTRVHQLNFPNQVSALFLEKLRQFPASQQKLLTSAALLGTRFEAKEFAEVVDLDINNLYVALDEILSQSILLRDKTELYFFHDQLQAAAVQLLDDEEKKQIHQKIARHLIKTYQNQSETLPSAEKSQLLFDIVEHLAGAEASEAALSEAALFNFLAGQAAMKALAHQESFHYFNQSGALTTAADWKRDYHFMRDLHTHWARAALILAERGKAQFIISNALQHAKDNTDRAQFLLEQILVSNSLSQQEASVQLGRECCRLLEVPLPETEIGIQAESTTLLVELAQSNVISRLNALPEVTDPKTLLTLNLYAELLAPAYFSGQHALYFLLSCRAITLGLHKGQNHFLCTPLGTLSYYFYSQNQPILAQQYENKMLAMAKANPDDTTSIMALGQGLWLTLHQTHSIAELESLTQQNITHGIRSGELNYTALTHVALLWYQLIQGRDFATFSQAINDCIVFCERYQLGLPLAISESMLYVLALVNSDANAQAEIQQKLQEWEDKKYFQALATFYCYQGIFLNFTENYAEAEVRLQQAEPYLFSISGTLFGSLWVVHRYLCGLRTANNPQQAEHLQQVSDWATTSDILKPFLALMQAETCALAKDAFDTVRSAYLNAIDSAHSQEYGFLEAYLHHQLGKWLEQQNHHSANMHLFQALQLYKKCHADYFSDLLETRFATVPLLSHVNNSNGATLSSQETLDSAFLLQVTQDIMQERDFNALIKKVLARVMERVGAKTGYLLTLESGQLKVRVLGKKNAILETELVNQDVHTAEFLCIEIARYTLRSGTALVLDNAAEQGDFTHSQAVRRYQLKSVLSIPLINQGRTLGLIYLENALIPGVFDWQQVKLVNVLTTQAAIALDNSLLISDLRNTQNVLSEREQNLAITLNSIGDGVIVCDAAGCVTLLNPMAQRLTGWNFDEAKGKPVRSIFSIIDSNTKEPILNPVDKVLATGETVHLSNHTTLLARNGEQYHIADSAAPIRDAQRNVIGMVLVFNDVTEAYRLRKEIAESHQKLSEVMSDIHTMVATLTPDGAITFINKKPLALAGMHSSNIINQKLWKTFWFNYDKDIQDRVQQACESAAQGQHVYCDLRMQSLDGPIWIDFALHPVKNELGHITLLVWEARDITSRKLAEEHLNEQKTAQTLILNNLADAVITTDQLGLVQSFNAAAEKIFGYSSDELIGQPITLLMTSPDATHHDRYVRNYINTGKTKIMGVGRELTARRKTGEVFPIHLTIAELPPTQDGGKRFVASIQDLSQRKQQQEILQRSQKMDALGKLTGGIAHDYNNMLGVILGYCDLLEPALKNQEKELGFLKQIRHAGERGATLTQKMLSYSRKKTVDLELVHLNQVLLTQKELLEKTLTVRIQLILQLNATEDKIFINQSDLEDCVLNLCINAMHAISDTGRLVLSTENLELDTRQSGILNISEGPYIVLTVEDNGVGMSEEILSKIFDPFFSTKGEKGTGLGLSQVYSFVERSKGAIKVSSSLGKGSVFSLYFPINANPNSQLAADQNNASEHTVKGTESILLVDDEPALLELTKEVLTQQGYQILCASSGAEAIEILQKEQVNLVLSDVIMPGMNGYQLARWIQQHCPHTHIQLISGFDDENATSAVDKLLNAQRLEKPVKASQLLSRIRKLLDTPFE